MSIAGGPRIISDGLIFSIDAANPRSYPRSGTSLIDTIRNDVGITLTNGPTFNTDANGNIVFDGTNDYATNTSYTPNVNTLSIWFKLGTTNDLLVIGVGDDAYQSTLWSWSIFVYAQSLYFRGSPGNGSQITTPVITNTWVNYTMIRNNGSNQCVVYRNGNFFATSSESTLTNTYTGLRINGAGSTYAALTLSSVQMYNRALTENEILQNYNATKGRYNL